MSKKMEEVKAANVRVVCEDFLQDVSASTKTLQELLSAHSLSSWGAEVKVEPVEVPVPKGKSAAPSKKSKGPVKEEGETPPALPVTLLLCAALASCVLRAGLNGHKQHPSYTRLEAALPLLS